jgi:hypothetical protein
MFIGGPEHLEHFLTLPVAEQMPDSLRVELALSTGKRVPMKAFDPSEPRDYHGRWSQAGGDAIELTDQEAVVVSNYVAEGYINMNSWLRTGTVPGSERKTVRVMDAAIAKGTLAEDTTVFRGIDVLADPLNRPAYDQTVKQGLPVGSKVSDKAFMSTSLSSAAARGFAHKGAIVAIHVPAGSHGLVVGNLAESTDEQEVILPRKTSIVIDRYDPHGVGGKPTVFAHVAT